MPVMKIYDVNGVLVATEGDAGVCSETLANAAMCGFCCHGENANGIEIWRGLSGTILKCPDGTDPATLDLEAELAALNLDTETLENCGYCCLYSDADGNDIWLSPLGSVTVSPVPDEPEPKVEAPKEGG